jgi:hypothetical protein
VARTAVVWSKYSCGAFVILEQSAESVMTLNRVTLPELLVAPIWEEQPVAFPLVISFGVIMSAVLGHDTRKRPLTEQDHFG